MDRRECSRRFRELGHEQKSSDAPLPTGTDTRALEAHCPSIRLVEPAVGGSNGINGTHQSRMKAWEKQLKSTPASEIFGFGVVVGSID